MSRRSDQPERLAYRVGELAHALGLPRSTLYDIVRRGDLRATKVGRGLVIFVEDLLEWKDTCRNKSPTGDKLANHRVNASPRE